MAVAGAALRGPQRRMFTQQYNLSVVIGQSISRYKIVERLGEGGMGVVYKAEDTTLGRPVALKFLAAHLLHDEEAKQRFLREAKSAAAITHPNICHVYEVGEDGGKTFLAMTYLKGETLEERIAKGPLPLKDALDLGRQVAEGLAAAHAEGIVHRDIKPANVMVSPDGRATILDFGLARLTEASKLTRADQTVGTTAYMSPEQIQGSEVDHRTDIWALGCVLYEMITGDRPFKGQYDQALAYEIVHEEPEPLTSIRAGVPMELEFIVGKCLAKQATDRYAHTDEIARDLRKLAVTINSERSIISTSLPVRSATRDKKIIVGHLLYGGRSDRVLMLLCAVGLLVISYIHFGEVTPRKAIRRFSFPVEGIASRSGVISPDGGHILYATVRDGQRTLRIRSLDNELDREVQGAVGAVDGFWAPDSKSIGFGTTAELKIVDLDGGTPATLCKLPHPDFDGGTWSFDLKWIIFSSADRLYRVSSKGGMPDMLFRRSEDERPYFVRPHYLPMANGTDAIAYTAATDTSDRSIAVMDLSTGERREIGPGDTPVWSSEGYLISGPKASTDRGLTATPFSLATLSPTGEPFPISADGVVASTSQDGTLVYIDNPGGFSRQLVLRNRSGQRLGVVGVVQPHMAETSLSPDQRSIIVQSHESGSRDLWLHDLERPSKVRLTFDEGDDFGPTWHPSGLEFAYVNRSRDASRIILRAIGGDREPRVLVEASSPLNTPAWSQDGRYLVYSSFSTQTRGDIYYIDFQESTGIAEPHALMDASYGEITPALSPNSKFLAYLSDESGKYEVYVRTFPGGSGRWQVSDNGGRQIRWRHDGLELYYVEGQTLMAVSTSTDKGFTYSRPEPLMESDDLAVYYPQPRYDVSADGKWFVMHTRYADPNQLPMIRVVENWYEEFRDRE